MCKCRSCESDRVVKHKKCRACLFWVVPGLSCISRLEYPHKSKIATCLYLLLKLLCSLDAGCVLYVILHHNTKIARPLCVMIIQCVYTMHRLHFPVACDHLISSCAVLPVVLPITHSNYTVLVENLIRSGGWARGVEPYVHAGMRCPPS